MVLTNSSARRLPIWVLFSISFAAGFYQAEETDRPGYLSPPELYKVVEDSERTYLLSTIEELSDVRVEDFASVLWPSIGTSLEYPWIETDEAGGRSLIAYDLEEGCIELLHEGEKFYDAEKYDKAMKIYEKATKQFSGCYVAYSHVGDCHYFQGAYAEALEWYEKAIDLNPYDFRGHFYKGNTLFRLRWPEEARAAYVEALALRPHRESVVKVLQEVSDYLGVEFIDQPFMPRALARREEDKIGVYFEPDAPYWLAYGLCKGVWIGEPSHRRDRTGDSKHVWSLVEERQCLMSMLESYYALREDESIEEDPEMEWILSVIGSESLDGFVFYEIAYRLYPQATLLFPDAMFDETVKYVNTHVLAKTPEDQQPKEVEVDGR